MKRTIIAVHPSAELYGSDRLFARSVGAIVAHFEHYHIEARLGADGPLHARLREVGARTQVSRFYVVRRADLSARRLLPAALSYAVSLVRATVHLVARRPALLYVNTLNCPPWVIAAKLTRVRCVVHVREAEPDVPMVVKRLLCLAPRFADAVIANSEHTRRFLVEGGVRSSRITVLYNGYEIGSARHSRGQSGPQNELHLATIGRLNPRKGQALLLDAVAILERDRERDGLASLPLHIHLYGDCYPGWEWYERELTDRAGALASTVTFHGFVPDAASRMAEADLVIIPSLSEPFGGTAVEAALAGAPLVVSDSGGLAEIAQVLGIEDVAHLTGDDRLDAATLATAIKNALTHLAARRASARHRQELARKTFSPDRYSRDLIKLLIQYASDAD